MGTRNNFVVIFVLCTQCIFCYPADKSLESGDVLVFGHILFRHGDRNIVSSYPNDPWKSEKYWPEGFGQLTNIGKQQEYELGTYLRNRYFSLLSNGSYDRNSIYIQSTDVDRTLMSAGYSLAGMFPPKDREIWNEMLLWQAIPIHTTPEKLDHCPLYSREYKKYLESDEVRSIFKDNEELIRYLEEHTGLNLTQVFDIKSLYEALSIEQSKNLTLPQWTQKVFTPNGEWHQMARLSYIMDVRTKLMSRLKVGFLFREILDHFRNKKNGKLSPDYKLWLYSAHDATIVQILHALDLFESQDLPDYASCLFFELHKSNGTFYVEVTYKPHRGDEDPKPLSIPNCGQQCKLEKFFEIYHDIIPTQDFETECQIPSSTPNSSSNQIPLIWLVVGIIAIVIFN